VVVGKDGCNGMGRGVHGEERRVTLQRSDVGAAPQVSQGWPARMGRGCGGATG
jgi:hypothetical protein